MSLYEEVERTLSDLLKRLPTWGLLALALYLLRDFFGLIFLTFILSYIGQNVVKRLAVRFPTAGRRRLVVAMYVALLLGLAGIGAVAVPQMTREVRQLSGQVPQLQSKLLSTIESARENGLFELVWDSVVSSVGHGAEGEERPDEAGNSEESSSPLARAGRVAQPVHGSGQRRTVSSGELKSVVRGLARETLPSLLDSVRRAASGAALFVLHSLLAILFSFLILLDLDNLRAEVEGLRETRLKVFYESTAPTMVSFAGVVGRAFQAQAMIALANTVLTLIGMLIIGIPHVMVLSLVVFFCSFIPVLGVVISSIPICLVGLNEGGFAFVLYAIILILVIHTIEAYILNPKIYGAHLRMNPVVVLVILLLGEHLAGVWGLLLGVPVCYYLFTEVLRAERASGTVSVQPPDVPSAAPKPAPPTP